MKSIFIYISLFLFLLKPSSSPAQTYNATTDCDVTLSVSFDFTTCLCPTDTASYYIVITDASHLLDSLDISFLNLHGDTSLLVNILNTSSDTFEVALPNGIPDNFILDFVLTQDTCVDTLSIRTDIYQHLCPTITTSIAQNLFFQGDSDASIIATSSSSLGFWYSSSSLDIFDDSISALTSSDSVVQVFIDSLDLGLNSIYFHYNVDDSLLCSTSFIDSTIHIYMEKPLSNRISSDTICINAGPLSIDTTLQDVSFHYLLSGTGVVSNIFYPTLAGVGTHQIIMQIYNADSTSIISDTLSVLVLDTPVVSFALPQEYVFSNSSVGLTASPAGGIFSGIGVSGDLFTPSSFSSGYSVITYTYHDSITGCMSQIQDSIVVLPSLQSLIDTSFCDYESIYTLPLHVTHIYGAGVSSDESILHLDSILSGTYIYQQIFDSGIHAMLTDSFQIVIHSTTSPNFTLDTLKICTGTPVSLYDYTEFNVGTFDGIGVVGTSFQSSSLTSALYPVIHTTTSAQCSKKDTLLILVYASPVADLSSIDLEFCKNEPAYLIPVIPDLYEYREGGTAIAYFDVPNMSVGTHLIQVELRDRHTCSADTSVEIQIYDLPVLQYLHKDTIICKGDEAQLELLPSSGSSYHFEPSTLFVDPSGSLQNVALTQSTQIFIQATDFHQCVDIDTISIQVENCFTGEIVSVFSPNGDGKNDTWVIKGIDGLNNLVEVYNRWGELLVSFYNYQNNWHGNTEKGDLPDGVYYYQISVKGYVTPFTGTITIVR